MYLSIGSIIIDDIVLPDGRTQMGSFGGGSTHAVAGMRVWSQSVGISAWVGTDFPPEMEAELSKDFDLGGVVRYDLPSARAWQLFEADGKRTEIFRTDLETFIRHSPQPEDLPAAYWSASGVHYQNDMGRFSEWVERFRAGGSGPILWEPWGEITIPENRDLFRASMPLVEVVSPNLLEAQKFTGREIAEDAIRALLDDGARAVALRMGGEGSLVSDGHLWCRVPPAHPERIVDVTGAGNAYCGGFVVGLAETGDLVRAACMGAVAASFSLEQFGAMYDFSNVRQRAQARLEALLPQVTCATR